MGNRSDIDKRHPERRAEDAARLRTRHRLVGENLRRQYKGIVAEPIPQEFIELLEKVDRKAKSKDS